MRPFRLISLVFIASLFLGLFAQSNYMPSGGISNIGVAANYFCANLMAILPPILLMLIVAAGVVYAAGQIFGAETRARANTWATAMLVGCLIGTLIIVVAPSVLAQLYNNPNVNFSCGP